MLFGRAQNRIVKYFLPLRCEKLNSRRLSETCRLLHSATRCIIICSGEGRKGNDVSLEIRIKESVLRRWQARATLSEIAANAANGVEAAVAVSTRDNERGA